MILAAPVGIVASPAMIIAGVIYPCNVRYRGKVGRIFEEKCHHSGK